VKKISSEEHIQEAFSYFDKNKSGYIEIEELREALSDELEGPAGEDIINSIIHDVDTDKVSSIFLGTLYMLLTELSETKLKPNYYKKIDLNISFWNSATCMALVR
jgi:Ca2+-binding EF-hand superfamily protein